MSDLCTPEMLGGGDSSLLLLCDHASDHVPGDLDLGIDAALLGKHIGVDIGAEPLVRSLAAALDAPAVLATVSRLVIDLHREPDHAGLIPAISDGHAIPGNEAPDRTARIIRFHGPYHAAIAGRIVRERPALIVAIHSFTQTLESGGDTRPWEVGILYNRDDRAARIALTALAKRGVVTGDNEPYSGRLLNATLNRHGEGNGIACISIEVRNGLIAEPAGVAHWSALLADVIAEVRNGLASGTPSAT